MAELARFFCEEHETEDCLSELVKSYKCPSCEEPRFSYLITIRPGNLALQEYAHVSVSLTCLLCGRTSFVHPVVKDGTAFYMSGGDGTGFNASLCNRFSKAIQTEKRQTSTGLKSKVKKSGPKKVTSFSRTGKAGKR